jgi:uncharacterized protein with GYD domain
MAHYILLMKLSPAGQAHLLEDPEALVRAHAEIDADEVTGLGLYAVLGAYDVVGIIEAPDNEAAARYSLQLGVMAGASIQTLPAVPLTTLDGHEGDPESLLFQGVDLGGPDDEP